MKEYHPDFVLPIVKEGQQYPFDGICEQIIRELAVRNFNVPGMKIDFHRFGSGRAKCVRVNSIEGNNFRLWFSRSLGKIGKTGARNSSGASIIIIPGMQLLLYSPSDGCGPTVYKYAGSNWAEDCESFKSEMFRIDAIPPYIVYTGKGNKSPGNFWPDRLNLDNDFDWQNKLSQGHPASLKTDEIFNLARDWLNENVLAAILAQPRAARLIDQFAPEEPLPVPSRIGPLFTLAESRDCTRIIKGQKDIDLLEPEDQFALRIGSRFVWLDVPSNDGAIPAAAYDGSIFCGIGAVDQNSQADDLDIPGFFPSMDQKYVVRVNLNRANDVYIANLWPYEMVQRSLFGKKEKGAHLTNSEVNLCTQASGRTVIPLASYTGGYWLPVILVNRELDLDEIQIVSGPRLDSIIKRALEV